MPKTLYRVQTSGRRQKNKTNFKKEKKEKNRLVAIMIPQNTVLIPQYSSVRRRWTVVGEREKKLIIIYNDLAKHHADIALENTGVTRPDRL